MNNTADIPVEIFLLAQDIGVVRGSSPLAKYNALNDGILVIATMVLGIS